MLSDIESIDFTELLELPDYMVVLVAVKPLFDLCINYFDKAISFYRLLISYTILLVCFIISANMNTSHV